jgi:hypothetical protein
MANVKRSGILITSWPFREDDFTSLVQYAVRLEETLVLNHLQRVFKSVMSKHPTSQFNRAEDAAHATSAYCSSPAGPPWDCSPKGRFECTPPAARVSSDPILADAIAVGISKVGFLAAKKLKWVQTIGGPASKVSSFWLECPKRKRRRVWIVVVRRYVRSTVDAPGDLSSSGWTASRIAVYAKRAAISVSCCPIAGSHCDILAMTP